MGARTTRSALCVCVNCKDLPFTVLLNWHHKTAEKWSCVHASTSTSSHTWHAGGRCKAKKSTKRKLRSLLVISCSFVSLFHLLLCVLLKKKKNSSLLLGKKKKKLSKKERVPLAAVSTL